MLDPDMAWPPEPIDELRDLFSTLRMRSLRPQPPAQPSLFDILTELDDWLGDARDYSRPRKDEWSSLIEDVNAALETRGPLLQKRTPALTGLAARFHPQLGRDTTTRAVLRSDLGPARAELSTPDAGADALDDLYAAITDPATRAGVIAARLEVLASVLAFNGESLATLASTLGDVAADRAVPIAHLRHQLDATAVPDDLAAPAPGRFSRKAGATADERLELMRRLIYRGPSPRSHVVWVFYGAARFEPWLHKVGPVTFLDGDVLTSVLKALEGGRAGDYDPTAMWWYPELPPELLNEDAMVLLRSKHNWPSEKLWVAARVDLGPGSHLDPELEARRQVEALVGLAELNYGLSSWVPLSGHIHVADSDQVGGSWPIERLQPSPGEEMMVGDSIDSWIVENDVDLRTNLPVSDTFFAELVDCIRILNESSRSDALRRDRGTGGAEGSAVTGPVTFLERVRVIELLATRYAPTSNKAGSMDWRGLLNTHVRDSWVRHRMLDRIFRVVERAAADIDLRRSDPTLEDLMSRLVTSMSGSRVRLHYYEALCALPGLAAALPAHHSRARDVRDLAARTADVAAVAEWADELREQHRRQVGRAHRCRNSLIHGGPFRLRSMATVNGFVAGQAGTVTVVALRAVLKGSTVRAGLDNELSRSQRWSDRLATATSVTDALFT